MTARGNECEGLSFSEPSPKSNINNQLNNDSDKEKITKIEIEHDSKCNIKHVNNLNLPPVDWFSYSSVSDIEKKVFQDFFNGTDEMKTPHKYLKARNIIYDLYHADPTCYLTLTTCRRYIPYEACTVMRMFSFLEQWRLINSSSHIKDNHLLLNENNTKNTNPSTITLDCDNTNENILESYCAFIENKESYTNNEDCNKESESTLKTFNSYNSLSAFIENSLANYCNDENKITWSSEEICKLLDGVKSYGDNWHAVVKFVDTNKSITDCIYKYLSLADCEIYDEINNDSTTFENQMMDKSVDYNFLDDPCHPLVHMISALASAVHPKILNAACKAAIDVHKSLMSRANENSVQSNTDKHHDYSPYNDNLTLNKAVENMPNNYIDDPIAIKAVCGAVASVIVKTKERQNLMIESINSTVKELVENQLNMIDFKLKELNELEQVFNLERDKLGIQQQMLSQERILFQKEVKAFNHDVEMFKDAVARSVNNANTNDLSCKSHDSTQLLKVSTDSANSNSEMSSNTFVNMDKNSSIPIYNMSMNQLSNSPKSQNIAADIHDQCNILRSCSRNIINNVSNVNNNCDSMNSYVQTATDPSSSQPFSQNSMVALNSSDGLSNGQAQVNSIASMSNTTNQAIIASQNTLNNQPNANNNRFNMVNDSKQFAVSSQMQNNRPNSQFYNQSNSNQIPINANTGNQSTHHIDQMPDFSSIVSREMQAPQHVDAMILNTTSHASVHQQQMLRAPYLQDPYKGNLNQQQISLNHNQAYNINPLKEQYILQQQLNMVMNPANNTVNINVASRNPISRGNNPNTPQINNQFPIGFPNTNSMAAISNLQQVNFNTMHTSVTPITVNNNTVNPSSNNNNNLHSLPMSHISQQPTHNTNDYIISQSFHSNNNIMSGNDSISEQYRFVVPCNNIPISSPSQNPNFPQTNTSIMKHNIQSNIPQNSNQINLMNNTFNPSIPPQYFHHHHHNHQQQHNQQRFN